VVESQGFGCPYYKYEANQPGWSWSQNTLVTVRIDDTWTNEDDRQDFADGIAMWNSGANCSGVRFTNFSPKTFTSAEYEQDPPNNTVYWQRAEPNNSTFNGGVFMAFNLLGRVKAARVKIKPSVTNITSGTYYNYLGSHEIGHTFNLKDCLCSNQCTCSPEQSIMSGNASAAFNTGGPNQCDNGAVDQVYCPFIAGTAEECESQGRYWNYMTETCQDSEATCAETCFEGGLDKDLCKYPTGCPPGYSYGELRGSSCCDPIPPPPCPVVVDVDGKGFHFTNAIGGVSFDIDGDGDADQISWTDPTSTNAWLALDRNGNGVVDNGTELFGNFTVQTTPPAGEERNGFLALAEYDKPANGGNGDGIINKMDSIFSSLRLWQDRNHNGISEAGELSTLQLANVTTLELNYKTSKYTDQYGNEFRYRAKVKDAKGTQVGRWMQDVFVISVP